jgi:type 1 glutamine amidotransferase
MKRTCFLLLTLTVSLSLQEQCEAVGSAKPNKKVVLIAGKKSHPPAMHEYIKSARLLKVMLDTASNLTGVKTEVHYNGWPENSSTLEDADVIMTISDGQDGPDIGYPVPFMTAERMAVMERQMKRGCGFITFHFSTFAPDDYGEQILDWGGGYFDWQDEGGKRNWYSAIKTLDTEVQLPSMEHPIVRGVRPFRMLEEFYYNIRFRSDDRRLVPLLSVPALESNLPNGKVVAWAVQRVDGGRGFGTTTGHYYANWKNPDYRKLILNAIVWASRGEVPAQGVESRFYTDDEITRHLFGKSIKGLILTGQQHEAHNWRETTAVLKQAIEKDDQIYADVSTDIEDLSQYDLRDYAFLVLNYCNWKQPQGLSDRSKKAFTDYLSSGGGLLLIHFANGAFHHSLPDAGQSDWPEYRNIVRRVWDHSDGSEHDPYGTFRINTTNVKHEIVEDLTSFETTDELYFNQKGDKPIEALLTARSKVSGKEEPLAWVYQYGRGRIFQTLLGHDARALETPAVKTIIQRAAAWAAKGHQIWNGL